MPAVARVHHVLVRLDVPGDKERRPRGVVPHDEDIGLHRREVGDGIEQRLALGLRRHRDVEVDDIGRQPLGGDLEGGARARRGLEEQVEHALAPEQRHLLYFALGDADERFGGVEDLRQDLARQAFDGQQVLQLARGIELWITLHF